MYYFLAFIIYVVNYVGKEYLYGNSVNLMGKYSLLSCDVILRIAIYCGDCIIILCGIKISSNGKNRQRDTKSAWLRHIYRIEKWMGSQDFQEVGE